MRSIGLAFLLSSFVVQSFAAQPPLADLNGYFEVSGLDGTIGRISSSGRGASVSFSVELERAGTLTQAQGYRPGDIMSQGVMDVGKQVTEVRENFKASASPKASLRNAPCDVFLGEPIRHSVVAFRDESGAEVPGVYTTRRITPLEEICKTISFASGQCRIDRCITRYAERDVPDMEESIWTRERKFAERYASGVEYRGKSYAQLAEEGSRDFGDYQDAKATEALVAGIAVLGGIAEAMREAEEQRKRERYLIMQRRYAAQQQAREQALADLAVPGAEVCSRYAERERYGNFADLRLAGVQLGMDVRAAHDAMLCNGFTVDPNAIAKTGGLDKYLGSSRAIVYYRDDPGLGRLTGEIEAQPSRTGQPGSPKHVLSVRIRYPLDGRPSTGEIADLKQSIKRKYSLGGKKELPNGIIFSDRRAGQYLEFNVEAMGYTGHSYALSLCCGR